MNNNVHYNIFNLPLQGGGGFVPVNYSLDEFKDKLTINLPAPGRVECCRDGNLFVDVNLGVEIFFDPGDKLKLISNNCVTELGFPETCIITFNRDEQGSFSYLFRELPDIAEEA